ncbi:MAG: glycosyltransferase family 39 protein [Candidatus Promineifilaceae bacterium]|nr:glycosyltransferase family 39 protein [Candidatus Promineifilaceae bacterium]
MLYGKRRYVIIGLFLLWMAFVLSAYYLVQNAFLVPTVVQLENMDWLAPQWSRLGLKHSLTPLVVAFAILLAALGLGLRALHCLAPPRLTDLEQLVFGFGLGLGCLSLVVLIVTAVGWLDGLVMGGLLAAGLLLGGPAIWRLVSESRITARPPRLLMTLLVFVLMLGLTWSLQPPTSWDALFYHLTGPKLYLAADGFTTGLDIPHLSFPPLLEMLFMLAMGLGSDVAARLLHFAFVWLLLGLVYAFTRRQLPEANPWWAVAVVLSAPMVLELGTWAYNDLALSFFSLAGLHSLLAWRTGRGKQARRWLILAGLMSGLTMGLKYTSFVVPMALGTLLVYWLRHEPRRLIVRLTILAVVTLLVAAPWYGKNLVLSGNPVYPFVWGGPEWNDFRAAAYAEAGSGIAFDQQQCERPEAEPLYGQQPSNCRFAPLQLAGRLVSLPLDLTLGLQDASRDGDPGPLFLILLPPLLIIGLRRRQSRPAAVGAGLFFAFVHYAFWTVGVAVSAALWQARLLLPAFVVLAPLLAWLLSDLGRWDSHRFSLQRLLYLVIGLVLAVGILIQSVGWLADQPWGYLLGGEDRAATLERRLGAHYLAMEAINDALPADARVKFLWEPRSYYCQRTCQPDSILDAFGEAQYLYGRAPAIAAAWRKQGFSHVLLFRAGLDFVLQASSTSDTPLPEPEALQQLLTQEMRPVLEVAGGAYELYALSRE